MTTPNTPSPIVAVQVVLVRREGDKETLQSVDIPIRNPLNADIELVTDERGINLAVNVMNDPRYSISYVVRTHEAADHEGKLHPYCDGINSDVDVAGIRAGLEYRYAIEIDALERTVQKRDRTLRKLRKELKALKQG